MTDTQVQELLKPRYKVIADYPDNPFKVGTILNEYGGNAFAYGTYLIYKDRIESYPHLFKRLEWWEERRPEEMPKYVKGLKSVKRVVSIEDHGGEYPSILCEGEEIWGTIWMYQPATEEEYISFINQTNSK